MKLKGLIEGLEKPDITNLIDLEVEGIACNSKLVKPGFLFVAIKGTNDDGHRFIKEAIKNGARTIIAQEKINQDTLRGCSLITVADTRLALAKIAAKFYGYPSHELKVIGITGTNGKTTVSYLIENLLKQAGYEVGVLGTINYRFKEKVIAAKNTTPQPLEIQPLLAEMKEQGLTYVVMEVSSHALDQSRVEGINFSHAIFTNLTHDHLDYHLNMESYFEAKAKLFKSLAVDSFSIINTDDPFGRRLLSLTAPKIITYGLNKDSLITASEIRFDIYGGRFMAKIPKRRLEMTTKLIGRHNIYNILACIAFGITQGLKPKVIKASIENFKSAPGRLERVRGKVDFSVFVDYAHTDDALKNVLTTLREFCKKRIIVVFGCGGNRDRMKRPKMGRVASELADFAIVTSDNPRDEEPGDIIKDIIQGIKGDNYKIIPSRREAIFESLKLAGPDDIVLIAGKGHEDYQVIKGKTMHFDDRQIVKECLKSMN